VKDARFAPLHRVSSSLAGAGAANLKDEADPFQAIDYDAVL
jgi:hypothetical protein